MIGDARICSLDGTIVGLRWSISEDIFSIRTPKKEFPEKTTEID